MPASDKICQLMTTAELSSYRRPWWLPNSHLETIWARFVGRKPEYTREIITTFDNDIIALDYLIGKSGKPTITIFHGLEGCSRSHTVANCALFFHACGWNVFVPHFRTCGIMNRLPRAYHAGDSQDVGWMLKYIGAASSSTERHFALGVSLGGNALAKWLGENPQQQIVEAAATICAPYDLEACSRWMSRVFNHLIYERHFLRSLRVKMISKIRQYPALADVDELKSLNTMRQFDNRFTAALHGYTDVDDYYRKASAMSLLTKISTPLLSVHSDNDVLVPRVNLPANPHLHAITTRGGGHSGYVTGPFPGSFAWLSSCLREFFERV